MSTQYSHMPGSQIELAERMLKAAIQSWNQIELDQRTVRPVPLFITVNTATLSADELVECVAAIVRKREPARIPGPGGEIDAARSDGNRILRSTP